MAAQVTELAISAYIYFDEVKPFNTELTTQRTRVHK
jgi:hypothetical protein